MQSDSHLLPDTLPNVLRGSVNKNIAFSQFNGFVDCKTGADPGVLFRRFKLTGGGGGSIC